MFSPDQDSTTRQLGLTLLLQVVTTAALVRGVFADGPAWFRLVSVVASVIMLSAASVTVRRLRARST